MRQTRISIPQFATNESPALYFFLTPLRARIAALQINCSISNICLTYFGPGWLYISFSNLFPGQSR